MAISTLIAEIARRGGDRRLIGAARLALLALHRRVEAVGNQVQQHPRHLLGIEVGGAGVRVERFDDRHVEAGFFGARAVIGEVERLLDHRVDVDARALARPLARMQQHVLHDRIGALAVLNHLVEIAADGPDQFVGLVALGLVQAARLDQRSAQFVDQLARQGGEIVDEIERVLDLVGDAGGELAERGELFRLDQPVLRLAQVVERGGEFFRARLHLVEQAHVLDRDHGLVGEGLDDLDLACGEMSRLLARQHQRALDPSFRSSGTPRRARAASPATPIGTTYSGSSRTSGIASTLPDSSTRPAIVPRPGVAGCSSQILAQSLGWTGAGAASIAEDFAVANADRAADRAAELDGGATSAYRTPLADRTPSG